MAGMYSSDQVVVSLGGERLTGFAKGSAIKAELMSDEATDDVGLDGRVAVSLSVDRRGTFTFELQAGSPSNAVLQRYATLLRNRNPDAFFAVEVNDLMQRRQASAARCWVKKRAGLEAAPESGSNTWTVGAADMDIQHQGEEE